MMQILAKLAEDLSVLLLLPQSLALSHLMISLARALW
jgi:hypothetical protein